jgi:hypothetical protein
MAGFQLTLYGRIWVTPEVDLNQNPAIAKWWARYTSPVGDTASPISLLQYVDITNMLSTPETIKTYSVALNMEGCGWIYLYPIYVRDISVLYAGSGLQNAALTDFTSNGLDYGLEKAIPANETVSGFWFFESTEMCRAPKGTKLRYRFSLETYSNIQFEYTTPEIQLADESSAMNAGLTQGHPSGPIFVFPATPRQDITKLFVRLGGASGGIRVKRDSKK